MVANLVKFFFQNILQSHLFQGAHLNYDNSFLKLLPKIRKKRHLWYRIEAFLFLRKVLHLDKFEGGDFKYDNRFLKFYLKNTKITHFWSEI